MGPPNGLVYGGRREVVNPRPVLDGHQPSAGDGTLVAKIPPIERGHLFNLDLGVIAATPGGTLWGGGDLEHAHLGWRTGSVGRLHDRACTSQSGSLSFAWACVRLDLSRSLRSGVLINRLEGSLW